MVGSDTRGTSRGVVIVNDTSTVPPGGRRSGPKSATIRRAVEPDVAAPVHVASSHGHEARPPAHGAPVVYWTTPVGRPVYVAGPASVGAVAHSVPRSAPPTPVSPGAGNLSTIVICDAL